MLDQSKQHRLEQTRVGMHMATITMNRLRSELIQFKRSSISYTLGWLVINGRVDYRIVMSGHIMLSSNLEVHRVLLV